MKLAIAILLLAICGLRAVIPVHAVVQWDNMSAGQLKIANPVATACAGTSYFQLQGGNGVDFVHMFVTNGNDTYTLPSVSCAGQTFTSTGTNWLRYEHGNSAVVFEALKFKFEAFAQSNFACVSISGFVKFCATNDTISTIGFDHITLNSSWFQQHIVSGGNYANAEAQNGGGGSTFGDGFDIQPATVYAYTFYQDTVNDVAVVKFYHPTTFALFGTSTTTSAASGADAVYIGLQSVGNCQGWTEWSSIVMTAGSTVVDIFAGLNTQTVSASGNVTLRGQVTLR